MTPPLNLGHAYKLVVHMEPRQPGNMERITAVILDHHVDIKNKTQKNGPRTELVIGKTTWTGQPLKIYDVAADIRKLIIRRGAHRTIKNARRMALHFPLADVRGSLNTLEAALAQKNIRAESFILDQMPGESSELCDFILRVPNTMSDKDLQATLSKLEVNGTRLLAKPEDLEISNADMTETTAQAALRLIERKLRALGEEIPETLLPGASDPTQAGSVDQTFLNDLQKAMDIAFDYHGNVDPEQPERPRIAVDHRRKNRGQPFAVHPLEVLHASIVYYGIRNPITAFAIMNHDVVEDGPMNVADFVQEAFETHILRETPLPNIVETLKSTHPTMKAVIDEMAGRLSETGRTFKPDTSIGLLENKMILIGRLHEVAISYKSKLMQLASAEINARFKKDFPANRQKLLQSINAVTKKAGYMTSLKEKEFPEFRAMKTADRAINLHSIFEVSRTFATEQLEDTIQNLLPLLMAELPQLGAVTGRRHFLGIFIPQYLRLMNLLDMQGRDAVYNSLKNVPDLADMISEFNRWLVQHPEYIPTDIVTPAALSRFVDDFGSLGRRIGRYQRRQFPTRQQTLRRLFPSFHDYMVTANRLYYAHQADIRPGGHFSTLPVDLSPFFGAMVAEQAFRMWRHMRQTGALSPDEKFTFMEFGGGTGVLLRDVLTHISERAAQVPQSEWGEFWHQFHYTLYEQSPRLYEQQRQIAEPFLQDGKVWLLEGDAQRVLMQLPPNSFKGVVFANELLDDLGSHKVILTSEGQASVAYIIPQLSQQMLATM